MKKTTSESDLIANPIPKRRRITPVSIGFLANRYGPVVTISGGGLNGTGVPFAFRKWSTDHAVTPAPTAMSSIAMNKVGPLANGQGSESNQSMSMDRITKIPVNTPKIINPIGVRRVRVFLVAVAAR